MIYRPSDNVADPEVRRELLRISEVLNALVEGRIPVRTQAPSRPFDGQFAIADGVSWDPLSTGLKQPVWYNALTATWIAL